MTPFVFLHGFLGEPSDWDDVRNDGNSLGPSLALPIPVAESWDEGIEKVAQQLRRTSILVGYSLGGRVALGVTLTRPRQVRALCLISAHPGLESSERPFRLQHDAAIIERIGSDDRTAFLHDWYRQPVFESMTHENRNSLIQRRADFDRDYQSSVLRCYSIARQPNFWGQLDSLETPTTVIVGERDTKYVAIARKMKECAPRVNLHIVPSAGHAVHHERPAAVQNILREFGEALPREKQTDE